MKMKDAPMWPSSRMPPSIAVLPSAEMAAEDPWAELPAAPAPIRLEPRCDQTPPLRVKTQAAPVSESSLLPPTIAVSPSAERATEIPSLTRLPDAPVPTSLAPCCDQTPPLRVKTQAAPVPESSFDPPRIAVEPSEERATEQPCSPTPTAPVP